MKNDPGYKLSLKYLSIESYHTIRRIFVLEYLNFTYYLTLKGPTMKEWGSLCVVVFYFSGFGSE